LRQLWTGVKRAAGVFWTLVPLPALVAVVRPAVDYVEHTVIGRRNLSKQFFNLLAVDVVVGKRESGECFGVSFPYAVVIGPVPHGHVQQARLE
jgi:hypothetical protein